MNRIINRYKPEYASLVRRLSSMIAANQQPNQLHDLFQLATTRDSENGDGWQVPILQGLSQGLENRTSFPPGLQKDQNLLVETFFDHPSASVRQACLQVLKVIGLSDGPQADEKLRDAAKMAGNHKVAAKRRAQSVEFLSIGFPGLYRSLLKELIDPSEPTLVQIAAVRTFSRVPGTAVSQFLLINWPELIPPVRDEALSTFLIQPFNPERITLLLDAIESGLIQPESIDWPQKVTLMRDIPDSLKTRGRSLLADNEQKDQKEILEYVKSVKQKISRGNPVEGRTIFLQHCIICHQLGDMGGVNYGPSLGSVASWQMSDLVENIVDPSMAITRGFSLWQIEMKSGKIRRGIIASQTPSAVTLRDQQGVETTLARPNIVSLKSLNISAMPNGFKDKINPQEMADLIAFIRNTK